MKKVFSVMIVVSLLALLCVRPLPAQKSGEKLQGTITISGAWALYPMVVKWAEEFRKVNPDVRIDISAGGAGKGIADALADMVDLGMVSREVYPAEVEKGAWFVPVTKDAVVPVINTENPLFKEIAKKGVKKSDFARIWLQEEPPTWNELLGGKDGVEVHVYTRSDSCGAAETWALYLGKKQEDLAGVGVFGDPGIAEAVRKDARGIGFNNVNYAFDASTKKPVAGLRIIPIDTNGNGKIDAEENFYATRDQVMKAIAEGRYPSPPARDLYFVTKGRPAKEPLVSFIRWVLAEGQKLAPAAGYIPLAEKKLQEARSKLK